MSWNEFMMYVWTLIFVLLLGGGLILLVTGVLSLNVINILLGLVLAAFGLVLEWTETAKRIETEWYK